MILDLSGADCQTAIRMKKGQRVTFDVYDAIGVREVDGAIVFDNCGRELMRLDVNTGDLRIAGKLISKP